MRWLFLLATIPGCLWIGGAEHEARKRAIDPELVLLDITPDSWSACAGPPTFTVVAEVAARHAGRTFETWYEVDGKRSVSGTATAGQDGSLLFDVSPGELAPGCADTCPVTFTVGVSHLGFDDQLDVDVTILGQTEPEIAQAALVGADGAVADLATLVPDDNPVGSVPQELWPTLAVGIVDPYLHDPSSDLVLQVALCPQGTTPATGTGCVVQDAVRSEHVLAGDAVYEVPTAALAAAACAEGLRGLQWDPFVLVSNHPCATTGELAVPGSVRVVLPDCDADLFTVADGDCDDDDPTVNPDATETWYDGFDQDCDGANDYDRDGDGVLGGKNGTDCDDDDALTYPGAVEICDDADNDCDGSQLADVVTIESGGTVDQYATLDEALSAASAGETVRVCPGTFTGTFVIDQDLTVIGSGPDQTILRPAAADQPVVEVVGRVDVQLEGFEVTGATTSLGTLRGGGISVRAGDPAVLRDVRVTGNAARDGAGLVLGGVVALDRVTVTNNQASRFGGGLFIERHSLVTATDLSVSGNSAAEGGGLAIGGFAVVDLTTGGSRIEQNDATVGGGGVAMLDDSELYGGEILANVAPLGGGVYAHIEDDTINSQPWLEGVRIADHLDPGISRGGGLFATGEVMELYVIDSVIENNAASAEGGGLLLESPALYAATGWIEGTTIANNTASDGGGFHAYNTFLIVMDTDFDGNTAVRGGGMYNDVYIGLVEARFTNNSATSRGGGYYGGFGEVWNYYSGAEFTGNSASEGAALYLDDGWFVAPDVVMTGNTATGLGGGAYLTNGGHMGIYGSSLVNGNLSLNGETNGTYVDATGDSFVSCDTVSWSDSVGCDATPSAGVPANNCFSIYATGLDDGQCDICP